MKQIWKDMGIAATMGLIVPAVLLGSVVSLADKSEPHQPQPVPTIPTIAIEQQLISVLSESGEVIPIELDDYLTCVLLAEMPVSFADEALKAQSVVARTYTMRAANGAAKHEQAAVCTESSCCQGYISVENFLNKGGQAQDVERIQKLIAQTRDQVLTYDGELIEATYFSCSGGATEDAVAVWGTDVAYLRSVESPGEENATHYTDTVIFNASDFASRLGLALEGNPAEWFGITTYTKGGGVATMLIGGKSFAGTELRRLLELRSTAFDIQVDGNDITITTRGYGHRVGMSQYGADAMADAGSTYPEILAYYYQGTELTRYAD